MGGKTILNLGCGTKHVKNAVNLDVTPDTSPDVVHDLNQIPWPFPDNTFTQVLTHDVIEHLDDVIGVMEEIHRICQPDARVEITVPHFSCANAFTDPTHRHYFGWYSFHYVTGEHKFSFYTRSRYKRIVTYLFFHPSPFNRVLYHWANRNPARYEKRWMWIFPAWFLSFNLQVIKELNTTTAQE